MHDRTPVPPGTRADRALALAAGAVIIALTAAAFWLSYAHLAEVAAQNGLASSPIRAWAWPATLDLFIVAGELLMLRAALAGKVDPWAIGLTVAGSGGSIALNVAGVGTGAGTLDYVVAAVPPTAALLAFGALMRQVHQALAARAGAPESGTTAVVPQAVPSWQEPTPQALEVPQEVPQPARPAVSLVKPNPQLTAGSAPEENERQEADEVPAEVPRPEPREEQENERQEDASGGTRLPAKAAAAVIRDGFRNGASVADTAAAATRSERYVRKVYADLENEQDARPIPGQLALVGTEATA
ncbi:DUF2637 domain-containing protein [Streptomyces griseus]